MSHVNPNHDLLRTYGHTASIRIDTLASSKGDGDNAQMESRVKALEDGMLEVRDKLARIETKLEYVPTREDLVRVENTLIKWFISTAVALTGLAFAAAKWVT